MKKWPSMNRIPGVFPSLQSVLSPSVVPVPYPATLKDPKLLDDNQKMILYHPLQDMQHATTLACYERLGILV